MSYSAKEKLELICRAGGRASGRTYAAVQGCLATGATLLVASQRQADQLKERHPDLNVIAYSTPDALRGTHLPVLADHFLYEILIDEMGRKYMEAIRKLSEGEK